MMCVPRKFDRKCELDILCNVAQGLDVRITKTLEVADDPLDERFGRGSTRCQTYHIDPFEP